jgi:hypothetical protein
MKLNEIAPVLISITILIFVATIQKQSKIVAAITATMPVTIPLSLWIVYSSTRGEQQAMEKYTQGMVSGIIPTVAFTIALYVGARLGLKLGWIILLGYSTWAATLVVTMGVRRWLGLGN